MADDKNVKFTADVVVVDDEGRVLLITRKHEPFKGMFAIPGGHLDPGETFPMAAIRELREETGIEVDRIEFVGVYSEPGRDPRGEYVTIAYVTDLPEGQEVQAGDDAATAEFVDDWEDKEIGFDHKQILEDAIAVHLESKAVRHAKNNPL